MDTHIKQREIQFHYLHPDTNQARSAWLLFSNMPGIEHVEVLSPLRLILHYHLSYWCMGDIEALLMELGYHLDNSLMNKLKRALYHYTDENESANLGYSHSQNKTTRDVFINRYLQRSHGCRDPRPQHWRDYL